MAGETETMDMIEKLNDEFDVVVNENDELKKEIELLKGTINCRNYQLDKCTKHYSHDEIPECFSCDHRLQYDEEFVVCKAQGPIQRWYETLRPNFICQDCIDDGCLQTYKEEEDFLWIFTFMNGSSEVDDS